MGEYAKTRAGDEIKLGTCEDMYYLRADQVDEIAGYRFAFEVDRFRFPFPDEDENAPGHFDDYSRGWKVPGGYTLPETLSGDEHRSIQFSAPMGYLVSLPCPEQFGRADGGTFTEIPIGEHGDTIRVGRNGFSGGGATVHQQAYRGGVLVTLLHCGSCGAVHRLDTLEDAEPVIEAFRAEADRTEWRRVDWRREHLLTIAARIEAGYFTRTPGERVPA